MTIPEEVMIDEILPRLPVKSLMRFKAVCKSWRAIISGGDQCLITSHLQRSRQQLSALALPSHKDGYGVISCHFTERPNSCQPDFYHIPTIEAVASKSIPSHCDGLILFSSSTNLHVCNPATRKLVRLPISSNVNNQSRYGELRRCYNAAALGLDPLTKKYKVVRFFYRQINLEARTFSLGVEILTIGSVCWVPTQQDPPYPIWHRWTASTTEGIIYWLIDNTIHASPPQAIISFDLRDGKFGNIPPPPTWLKNLDDFHTEATLSVLDGDLCCMHSCGLVRHVCMYRGGMWQVRYSQQLDIDKQLLKASSLPLGTSRDGKILLNIGNFFVFYDPETQTTESIADSPAISKAWFHVIPYTESLLPIRFLGQNRN